MNTFAKIAKNLVSETHYRFRAFASDPFADIEQGESLVIVDRTVPVTRTEKELTDRVTILRGRGFRFAKSKGKAYFSMVRCERIYQRNASDEIIDYCHVRFNLEIVLDTTCPRCHGSGMYPSKAYESVCLACGGCGAKLKV